MPNKKIAQAPFETPNLAPLINKDELEKMGRDVTRDFLMDLESRREWSTRRSEWLKLFMGYVESKNFPWENCSNVPIPILTTAVIQFQARAYDAIMPSKNKMKVAHSGEEDIPKAERIEKHMNYQLDNEMERYEEGWDISLFQLPINGSVFRKIYYDPIRQRNVAKNCSADEIVIPYKTSPANKPIRITHKLFLTPNDLRIRQAAGVFTDAWDLGPGSESDITISDSEIKQSSSYIEGITQDYLDTEKPRVILEQHRLWDLDGDGIMEPCIITVDKEKQKVLRVQKRLILDEDGVLSEVEYFEHYKFWENPEGYYGLGFGHVLEGINAAAKALLDQIIDAGTLANVIGGFINSRSGVKKGEIAFKMGEFKKLDIPSDDIRKSIFPFQFEGPNNVLFSVLGLLQDYSTRVTTVSETMTGELPKSDTPAAAIINSVEQGMKVFSVIHKRIHRSFKGELKKLFELNKLYTPQEKYIQILGETFVARHQEKTGQEVAVGSDYSNMVDIQPVSDPNIISRAEKMAIAEQVLQHTLQNPATANDPEIKIEAYSRFYETLGVPDYEKLLEKPPPPPPDYPPEEENAMFIKEQGVQALEHQAHIQHLEVHDEFKATEHMYNELSGNGKNLMESHRREHVAFQYLKEEKERKEAQGGGQEQGGMAGMARPGGDQGFPGGPQGGFPGRGVGTA